MSRDEFLELLRLKDFPEPVLVEQPANGYLDVHTHDFEVMALITEGAITINCDGVESVYGAGDMFHLQLKQPHTERYGTSGVRYLASRKLF